MKKVTLLALAALGSLHAANIVSNPGFETSNFDSWTVVMAAEGSEIGITGASNSGQNAAFFAGLTAGDYDSISQTLNTIDGQLYSFSFFVETFLPIREEETLARVARADAPFDPVADFQVFWDGTMVLDVSGSTSDPFPYTQFASTEMGTGRDTITFRGYNVPAQFLLDDVSVETAAPEPAAWALIGMGLVAIGAIRQTRRAANLRASVTNSGQCAMRGEASAD